MKKIIKSAFYDIFPKDEADRLETIAKHVDKKAKTSAEHQKLWKRLKNLVVVRK